MTDDIDIPQPPRITEEQLAGCRETGDYCPILFEWYKYVAILCTFFASIRRDSPAVRLIPPLHYATLVGLLNRCVRLMLANVALSHEGLFGETTAILDRCIFESSIKLTWLCVKRDEESFVRFIAEGLKTELEFKRKIHENISDRAGKRLTIEDRMLASISRYISNSGLTEDQIVSAERVPDLAAMIQAIGHDRLLYIVGLKIGSHHVHGTWPSLWMHYLRQEGSSLGPRDHDCPTHVNQYVFVPLVVLEAMRAFARLAFPDPKDAEVLCQLLESVGKEIKQIHIYAAGRDFEPIEET
jgi:hypothetical protein